ncbi:hypothetical protein D3C80_1855870 [compost metagenome]
MARILNWVIRGIRGPTGGRDLDLLARKEMHGQPTAFFLILRNFYRGAIAFVIKLVLDHKLTKLVCP